MPRCRKRAYRNTNTRCGYATAGEFTRRLENMGHWVTSVMQLLLRRTDMRHDWCKGATVYLIAIYSRTKKCSVAFVFAPITVHTGHGHYWLYKLVVRDCLSPLDQLFKINIQYLYVYSRLYILCGCCGLFIAIISILDGRVTYIILLAFSTSAITMATIHADDNGNNSDDWVFDSFRLFAPFRKAKGAR